MPRISVVLPTCDRPALLSRAVESVLGQTGVEVELLLVDANRRTPPVADRHRRASWLNDARLRIVTARETANAAQARNVGLEIATGDWVTYLDDDDAYRAGKLEHQQRLAHDADAPLVVCGAEYHLRRRRRTVQCDALCFVGDDLLLRARWTTSLLFHRRNAVRFDPTLAAGEDGYFAHALLAMAGTTVVPCVAEPLVDVYQDHGGAGRTNLAAEAGWQANTRILQDFGSRFSPVAQERFRLRAAIARAKLHGETARCARLAFGLLRLGGPAELRCVANALAVSSGIAPGRFVT